MWIVQFLNTAVILLIINNKVEEQSAINVATKATGTSGFIFGGFYPDFNSAWYEVIGITLFTNAFITGVSAASPISAWFLGGCKRCWDRGCTCNEKKTKQILQEDYEAVYSGSLIEYDMRLSVTIAIIWVIMMFASAIPVLYLAGFVLCFVTYWTDKCLFLKYYKVPPKHGSDLISKARSVIEWSLVLHLFMGLYMLSNPDVFMGEGEEI